MTSISDYRQDTPHTARPLYSIQLIQIVKLIVYSLRK